MIPAGYVSRQQIDSEIERVKQKLGPEVVRVKHTIAENWSGDPAIYFRIVLDDSAAAGTERRREVTKAIRRSLFDELRPNDNWGLISYFKFRTQSEQAKVNDPAWA